VLLAAVSLVGCNRGKQMARVSGKVSYKDGSAPKAPLCVITLTPAATSKAEVRKSASSAIEPDGSFDMMTRQPGDGVYLGDYVVTFSVRSNPMDPTSSLIAPKYESPALSPYKLTVDGDKTDLRYEIEPAGPEAGASAGPAEKKAE
jgi:hypothetical protein